MTIEFFRIQRGLDVDRQIQLIYGTGAPITPDAQAAPVGSLFLDTIDGDLFTKNSVGTLLTNWQIFATQAYVNMVAGASSWRMPVIVADTVSVALPTGTPGNPIIVNSVSITNTQRVLFTTLTSGNDNVYIYDQPTGTFNEDIKLQENGDTLYVIQGSFGGFLFTYSGGIWAPTDQNLITEMGYNRNFMGKPSTGNVMPIYTSTNFIISGTSLTDAASALDLELGPNVITNDIISSSNSINENIQAIADLVEDNNKLTNAGPVTTLTIIDSVITIVAKWLIRIIVDSDPTRVRAYEIFATHNGTTVSYDVYSSLNIGTAPTGLQITISLSGGNTLDLNVQSGEAVNVIAKRVSVF